MTRIAFLTAALVLGACAAIRQTVVEREAPPAPAQTVAVTPTEKPEQASADAAADEVFGPIYYELESSLLKPESRARLERLADYLRKRPGLSVTINGHTCELGTAEYNLALGQRRAVAARDFLVTLGVEAGRVSVRSFGEEVPASDREDEEARAMNRRSEFELRGAGMRADAGR